MAAGLTSWTDGPARQAIEAFVATVTKEGTPEFVPPAARIAVFDNDGTLWCEKPMPIELGFILQRLAQVATANPELREKQPWKAALAKDFAWLGQTITSHYEGDDSGVKTLAIGILQSFGGMTIDDYQAAASAFFDATVHPGLKRPLRECTYAPMVELLRYLEAHGFTNYIVSGGDRDFVRTISSDLYGIPFERVVGSSNALAYTDDDKGGTLAYLAKPDVFDDGPVKPVRIWSRIGQRPLLAFGNANGDLPMLRFSTGPAGRALRLLLLHDDQTREFAYTAGADKALAVARNAGWTVVSMQKDWTRVFDDRNHP